MTPQSLQVLVTGASGFVGRQLCHDLLQAGFTVKAAMRKLPAHPVAGEPLVVDLGDSDAMNIAMRGVDVVVHLAARAHVLDDRSSDPLAAFRQANVVTSLSVARSAVAAGVKRFIFVSSIGVNGAETTGLPFSESMQPQPNALYAVSKLEAEQQLEALFAGHDTELVIIRPPLVYDAAAPGNFSRLLWLVGKKWPLPFAFVNNRRSMISLGNLTNFIGLAIKHESAAGELFVIADGESLSTRQIVQSLALGMGYRARLFFVPRLAMSGLLRLVGRHNIFSQLYGSLEVDTSKAERVLGWVPPEAPRQALAAAGRRFKEQSAYNTGR